MIVARCTSKDLKEREGTGALKEPKPWLCRRLACWWLPGDQAPDVRPSLSASLNRGGPISGVGAGGARRHDQSLALRVAQAHRGSCRRFPLGVPGSPPAHQATGEVHLSRQALEDGRGEVHMPYRFGSPAASEGYLEDSSVASFASFKNDSIS